MPDSEKPDPAKQALPGAADNSGCSYEFRYAENREDVTVQNHTRVHFSYKDKTLKLRVQQTSAGSAKVPRLRLGSCSAWGRVTLRLGSGSRSARGQGHWSCSL